MKDFQNKNLPFERRVADLVSRLTLSEKAALMLYKSSAVDRFEIPYYTWWNEALHGVARAGVATMFPQAIAMAATFDDVLLHEVADVISTEGRAKYNESVKKNDRDIYKGITFWTPNINIFRDPRWGRGQESYGEDPYLTGRLGVAFIKGLQGDHEKYLKTSACAKHFAVHSGPEGDRHSFDAVVSEKDLRETYLIAFKECVKEAEVDAVMGAYNRTNGEPCCGSNTLLVRILREEWGFKGHVISDCWAIRDFHEHHKVTDDALESVALAVNNGCDLNCGEIYEHLLEAVEKGLVSEEKINESVTRLMMTRMKLGMFDDPDEVPFSKIPYESNDCKEHNELSLKVAKKSVVLLKNKDNLLPLDKAKLKSVAVIGPNADSREALIGNYFGTASRHITVLEGIREALPPGTRLYYAQGCHLYKEKQSMMSLPGDRIQEAVSAAERSDVTVMCLGLDASIEGEQGDTGNEFSSGDKNSLDLPLAQQKLLEAVVRTGKPVILVLLSGSALAVSWADEHVSVIMQAWYPGSSGGKALASLMFGEESPSGRLPVTFYRTTKELPDFKDYSMKNRTYRYMENEALYPFGYGLSYTKFLYSEIKLSSVKINAGESITCSVNVKNAGKFESDEVVELYLKDADASVEIPRWELKGFRRIRLKKGKVQKVEFTIEARRMALIDNDGKCKIEPGIFEVYIGGSQPDARSLALTGSEVKKAVFEVTGNVLNMEY
jgi:beta-glucosidase